MKKRSWSVILLFFASMAYGAAPNGVQVTPANVHGSRPLESTTERAVIRDYLQAWKGLQSSLSNNDPYALRDDFTGNALAVLTRTVKQQHDLGISTLYGNLSHRIQIIFYSPNGLSIQMIDTVSYHEKILQKGKPVGAGTLTTRYIVVLTPTATRWMVRLLQGDPAD